MIALLWILAACGGEQQAALVIEPADFHGDECAVCGMLVGEQAAPRGQVLHRGGERRFVCSVADLRAYLAAPSGLGEPVGVWVEGVPVSLDVTAPPGPAGGWLEAANTTCAVGFDRPMTMGRPALCYARAEDAAAAATRLGGYAVDWAALRATGVGEDPPAVGESASE